MARLVLVMLLACVILLGLGWAGEAPAPPTDDECDNLDSERVPPDLVRTNAEGGGEIFQAYATRLRDPMQRAPCPNRPRLAQQPVG